MVDLPLQWELWADTECHGIPVIPVFRRGVLKLKAFEMANHPDASTVFRGLKRLVDILEAQRFSTASHIPFQAMDMAKFSVEMAFKMLDKWNPDLKHTGIEPARMR